MKEKLKYISNNIKSNRVRYGLSQEDMADKLGISRVTYCDYEANPQRLKVETLQMIADILCCNLADFFKEINVTESNTIEQQET